MNKTRISTINFIIRHLSIKDINHGRYYGKKQIKQLEFMKLLMGVNDD